MKKLILKKSEDDKKSMQNYPVGKELMQSILMVIQYYGKKLLFPL